MLTCDTLIRNASVLDGNGSAAECLDAALRGDRILEIGPSLKYVAAVSMDAEGLSLAPGFIDVHTHDDSNVIPTPAMLPKISQGVTTVIVGNCGIGVAPVQLHGEPPDPMNLLGSAEVFRYPTFAAYVAAIADARPAVNVAHWLAIPRSVTIIWIASTVSRTKARSRPCVCNCRKPWMAERWV
jgi:N-acyl-D-aspartate/D-glutamate deacylase